MSKRMNISKRHLKAAAAVATGLAAGTFVTAHRLLGKLGPDRDPRFGGARKKVAGLALSVLAPVVAVTLSACVDPGDVEELKNNQRRIIQMLQRLEKKCEKQKEEKPVPKKEPKVDVEQHRKGMPVPDNILE